MSQQLHVSYMCIRWFCVCSHCSGLSFLYMQVYENACTKSRIFDSKILGNYCRKSGSLFNFDVSGAENTCTKILFMAYLGTGLTRVAVGGFSAGIMEMHCDFKHTQKLWQQSMASTFFLIELAFQEYAQHFKKELVNVTYIS